MFFPFRFFDWWNLLPQPGQILPGQLQQSTAPLFPLKHVLGHLGWWRFVGAFPFQVVLHAHRKHSDPWDRVPQLLVQWSILGIQIVFLVLQDFLQALGHEVEAALDFGPAGGRVLVDLELREAGGPSTHVFPIGFILKERAIGTLVPSSLIKCISSLVEKLKIWYTSVGLEVSSCTTYDLTKHSLALKVRPRHVTEDAAWLYVISTS